MNSMDINEVLSYLPQRYPFLMIDRVVDYAPGEFLTGIKNVTFNEPYFVGHFPQRPIMPGVLILESLAQATGILAFKTGEQPPDQDSLYYFVGIDDARFKRPVEPGDQMRLEVRLQKNRRGIWVFSGEAMVEDRLAASATLMCTRREVGL